MSERDDSDRDREQEQEYVAKKRRGRACDRCRKRKVRCDGCETEGTACSTCVDIGQKCTYDASAEPRERRVVDEQYVKALESEVATLRRLVAELQAKLDEKNGSVFARPMAPTTNTTSPLYLRHFHPSKGTCAELEPAGEDILVEGFRSLCLGGAQHTRFMGRSSHFQLMKAAFGMKYELVAESIAHLNGNVDISMVLPHRRPQFWVHIFDFLPRDHPYQNFPEPALMTELVDSYFRTIHYDLPLLHRPTFLQNIASGLHFEDEGFGAIVLLVCALGARFSNNPATLPQDAQSWQLAGWQYFEQVRSTRKLIPLVNTIPADIKIATLAAAYVNTFATQYTNSSLIGHGLRLAQDLGAHRRLTYGTVPTIEGELHKRAFWCLVAMDRGMSASLGRPCTIQEEDFDVDYPIECDDEYWLTENPQNAFKQPPEKPSSIAYFNWYLRLTQIQARALRTIYSLHSSKILRDPESAQHLVADLDSELNQWAASLPEHLKYDANRKDLPFAAQAASLQAAYHHLRIFIHRPFIATLQDTSLPFPSSAICTNAARSSIQVLERYFALKGPVHVYQHHVGSMFQSAIILLLQVWRNMRAGIAVDAATEFAHVDKALHILQTLELHWDVAGRSWDILRDLSAAVQSRYGHRTRDVLQDQAMSSGLEPLSSTAQSQPQSAPTSATPVYLAMPPWNASDPAFGVAEHDATSVAGVASPFSVWSPVSGPSAMSSACGPLELDFTQGSTDPDLDAIFAELFPTLTYDDTCVTVGQQLYPSGQFCDEGTGIGPNKR
ncbi:Zn(II)2Cys6 transcription factor [Phanerochaete sordida]|uniref:Zn(II)2Cys6 transcription factor n=1 Tax=Phanerochaete sordida TaxID=48140 RepID=A0A9P3G8J5_9APHY|nr:Zn(II)2Cys6 transcription factor [Phanerochaete sordida]